MKLRNQLKPHIIQRFDGFDKTSELGMPKIYAFPEETDCKEWTNRLMEPVLNKVGNNEHVPIFRMSHGEYLLLLGRKLIWQPTLRDRAAFAYHQFLRATGIEAPHRSGPTANGTYEVFTKAELQRARETFIPLLREIAEDGLLAAGFQTNRGYREYCEPMFDWLEANNIPFNRNNYIPFYSIYTTVFGPNSPRLFEGRNVLVINYLPDEKKKKLEKELKERRGVAETGFISISAEQALFQEIDLSGYDSSVDLVLIGAGVGAASMIKQCKPLKAVCIDAGFAIDALSMPVWRWRRAFCIPDDEFAPENVAFNYWGRQLD